MDLPNELIRQKKNLEAADGVTVRAQYLSDAVNDGPHAGAVEVDMGDTTIDLDLYDRGGRYRVEGNERGTSWSDSWTRSTVADTLVLVSSLVHRMTGSREIDLDSDHWPPCRVVHINTHPTRRRNRHTRTVVFRGDYFECLQYVREHTPPDGLPSDHDVEIKGDTPAEHTVEEPTDEPATEGELPF